MVDGVVTSYSEPATSSIYGELKVVCDDDTDYLDELEPEPEPEEDEPDPEPELRMCCLCRCLCRRQKKSLRIPKTPRSRNRS